MNSTRNILENKIDGGFASSTLGGTWFLWRPIFADQIRDTKISVESSVVVSPEHTWSYGGVTHVTHRNESRKRSWVKNGK
jgi:hypothetical protein